MKSIIDEIESDNKLIISYVNNLKKYCSLNQCYFLRIRTTIR